MKSGFLDKVIDRLDRLDAGNLQAQFLRLAREKGFLETVFHALQEGVIVLDRNARVVFSNRAAERLIGVGGAGDVPFDRFLRGIDWKRVLNMDPAEWSHLMTREVEVNYPDHRFIKFYVVPVEMGESTVELPPRGAVVILRDITGERENEAKTIETERLRAITLLAAGVAHEIGNPLNALTIHLQLLQRGLRRLPPEHRKDLAELADISAGEVQRLDQILTQFLSAVRPVKPHRTSSALPEVLDHTLRFLRRELEDRKVLVEVAGSEGLPAVMVDRDQMRQAFFNLIKNAAEAMPGGGVLRVQFSHNDRMVAAAFQDAGAGIPADRMAHLFQPYFTTKSEGSGLGLMIVQRILRDHGGEIEVRSDPGRGATFTLYLPREDRLVRLLNAPAGAEPAPAPGRGRGRVAGGAAARRRRGPGERA